MEVNSESLDVLQIDKNDFRGSLSGFRLFRQAPTYTIRMENLPAGLRPGPRHRAFCGDTPQRPESESADGSSVTCWGASRETRQAPVAGISDVPMGMFMFMRSEYLKKYGLKPEDLTVAFDHPEKNRTFWPESERKIRRESNGFYNVTPKEWESLKNEDRVTLVSA